jgi:hypothetical protein
MAKKSIKDKVTDQIVSMVVRDLTKNALTKAKQLFVDQKSKSKKLRKIDDVEKDLEP